jgi:ribulokinase
VTVLLGLDLGTEGVRVGAFRPDGALIGSAEAEYPTSYPHPGWAEQDPEGWWRALGDAVRRAVPPDRRRSVIGIGLSTTSSTVVTLAHDGTVLRPAILWMDGRAAAEAEESGRVDDPVLRYSGGSAAVEWTVPKAMWLARNEPDIYSAAGRIVEAIDYLNWRLTGQWHATKLNAICKLFYDPVEGEFSSALYAKLGVPDLATKWPSSVLPVGAEVGRLLPEAADHLGLPTSTVVAEGGIDAHMAMLGMNVVKPGEVAMIAGTSVVHLIQSTDPVWHDGIWGPYPGALLDDLWLIEGGQVSAGSILRWAARLVGANDTESHRQLVNDASAIAPGAGGLLVLDFWQGNRTPYRDARLRGAILGLSLSHGAADIYRACVEALAYGTANVLDTFNKAGLEISSVTVCGGIRKNPLWLQTTADVLQRPLRLASVENPTLLAGAVAASVATGLYPSLRVGAAELATEASELEPAEAPAARYQEGYARYRRAVRAMRDLLHELADDGLQQAGGADSSAPSGGDVRA